MTIKEQILKLHKDTQRQAKMLYLKYQQQVLQLQEQCPHEQKVFNEWDDHHHCTNCGRSWHYTEVDQQ